MKNILVATDFSATAENAAHYAIALAKQLQADVVLCNAFKVPADAPMAAQVAWPLIDEADQEHESESNLTELIKKLDPSSWENNASFCPQLTFESEKGEVGEVVSALVKRKKIDLTIMGMAGAGQLVQWILGSNSKQMIDAADFPVLYIPFVAKYSGVKTIAFATDLSTDDVEPFQYICHMAETLQAKVMVYHITSFEAEKEPDRLEAFFYNVVSKLSYQNISYENIWHSDINEGLKWIRNNKEIDLVAMVHRQHSLLDKLVNGSYVHKHSRFTKVPLLVFQPSIKIYS